MMRRFAGLALLAMLAACSESSPQYRAEKQVFEADKLNQELSAQLGVPSGDFLDRTLNAYENVVVEFSPIMYDHEGLERLVLRAQMAKAELENRAGRYKDAKLDFDKLLELERTEPEARRNAMYSAGVMCEVLRDPLGAIGYFEKFFNDYISVETAAEIDAEVPRYLVTPLKLAELSRAVGNDASEALWLLQAETLYKGMLEKYTDEELLTNARFNLLAAYIQQQKWEEAEALALEVEAMYEEPVIKGSTTFLRARIRQNGFGDDAGALELYRKVYEDYPRSSDAPEAMIAYAGITLRQGDTDAAVQIYEAAVDRYPEERLSAAEALWRLANIAKDRGDWGAAVNRYREIISGYAKTSYALEAPLQVALGYQELGELDNVNNWYRRAMDTYREILTDRRESETMHVLAEEYILQVYTLKKQWDRAIEHLVGMPERYPDFVALHGNYVTAAEIYERELNDVPKAIEVLEECRARYPDSPVLTNVDAALERLRGQ